ncbi:alpha/beta hydrolase family protein [Leptospira inadai serovar Lyme str. 10]|uniref:Alpha/beta hydrolase family protein n=2 Tax=Leptospira inadai serovar Lyme TaxID=293084 RepID=V6HF49_9LEPT|nr:alpha/beta hydrolase [Leptospira inadai]EQA38158.1 alpha/beta hydrolase family protein [Leptospira inadai serovar Lyme str. 10]PNV73043.1 alpha/beta hydrolase [Leptospira inadai serovar Lyme]
MIEKYYLVGLPFLIRYAGFGFSSAPSTQERNLVLDSGLEIRTKLFPGKRNAPAVYIQHGMSARGIEDPRILELARHLHGTGFTVYLPELPEIKDLKISSETVPKIRSTFRAIYELEGRPVSYLSASFSAGMGMVALSNEEEQLKLSSTLLVGTYSDFSKTLPFVIANFDRDPYAVYVMLYNYIKKIRNHFHRLEEFFLESALDSGLQRQADAAVGFRLYPALSPEEREFVDEIRSVPSFRERVSAEILNSLPSGFIEENSPANFTSSWRKPIALLHGFDDPVISPNESEDLFLDLRNRLKDPPVFVKSRLLTHGDHLPFYTQFPEIPSMAKIWGFFIKNAFEL